MTDVIMPQMGESIAEGTIVRWMKRVGDAVDRDEPLFEISTDKVDAEIPSPAAGVLSEIRAKEGETVAVNSVVATIGESAAASAGQAPTPQPPAPQPEPARPQAAAPAAVKEPAPLPAPAPKAAPPPPPSAPAPAAAVQPPVPSAGAGPTKDDLRRERSSPLVRRIAREHNVDISAIQGTGIGGRVTKQDILSYVEGGQAAAEPAPPAAARAPQPLPAQRREAPPAAPTFKPGERVEAVPMSIMRKRIAEHMIMSRRTSAHVHSVFEVDFAVVDRIRKAKKAEYEKAGAKLTYTAFIAKATVDTIRQFPFSNASIDGDNIVYKKDVNLGIAVALDWGLIVPVVKNADEKNLLGLSRAIADVAERARAKQLKPEDVQGGTFTITNPGVFGALFGMPIINQPQVAILGIGAVEKRVVVRDDAIAISPRAYLTLGYDHRLIDGAVADEFMSHLKRTLETFDAASV